MPSKDSSLRLGAGESFGISSEPIPRIVPMKAELVWNPPGVAALYASLDQSTALAEGDHLIAVQSVPLKVTRTIYKRKTTDRRTVW